MFIRLKDEDKLFFHWLSLAKNIFMIWYLSWIKFWLDFDVSSPSVSDHHERKKLGKHWSTSYSGQPRSKNTAKFNDHTIRISAPNIRTVPFDLRNFGQVCLYTSCYLIPIVSYSICICQLLLSYEQFYKSFHSNLTTRINRISAV